MDVKEAGDILLSYVARHKKVGEPEPEAINRLLEYDKVFQRMVENYMRLRRREDGK